MTAPKDIRIACLLPSATEICVALGLEENIVGVTHECQIPLTKHIRVLTKNGLTVDSQSEIHRAISSTPSATCSNKDNNENLSFYPLLQDQFHLAKPNIIFTQDLCAVCAPTSTDVEKIVQNDNNQITIVSLQPTTLEMVADTFVTVAKACGVEERGVAFRKKWWSDLQRFQATILDHRRESATSPPKMFLLEWLDPPFDCGHWTYQMMDFACVEMANMNTESKIQNDVKSKEIEWNQVYEAKPDVIVVGCCGFDLDRNVQDTLAHADKFAPLLDSTRIFACDGNSYIAQPGPSLLQGVAILARCAYHDQPQVLEAIEALNIIPASQGFKLIDLKAVRQNKDEGKPADAQGSLGIGDIEDIAFDGGFAKLHDQACQEGKLTYDDPETGYMVFTELTHKNRGYCCGSGCRHCPFSHQNVGDKAKKIQQPAIIHRQSSDSDLFSLIENANVKV
jgi:iron complex transport system substrate-binding protein